jgi:hypothetical protein
MKAKGLFLFGHNFIDVPDNNMVHHVAQQKLLFQFIKTINQKH